jgi:hypothetical protein
MWGRWSDHRSKLAVRVPIAPEAKLSTATACVGTSTTIESTSRPGVVTERGLAPIRAEPVTVRTGPRQLTRFET